MTSPRPPRTIARAALDILAACALAVALILLIAPNWFMNAYYVPNLVVLPFMLLTRLPLWLVLVVGLRLCLRGPGEVESIAARRCAWAGIWFSAAGIMWMSDPKQTVLGLWSPGFRDIPWFGLLVASESARLAVRRGSGRARVVAIVALGLALGSSLSLGTDAMKLDGFTSLLMRASGSLYACVASRPWIAMIGLAGLWSWIGLADGRRAPPAAPE